MQIPAKRIFIIYSLILIFLTDLSFADPTKIVTGEAPISSTNAHKQALRDAFRSAIQKSVGVHVSSESIVENFVLLKDKIYAHSEGFVEKWEILNESSKKGKLALKVKVWVHEGRLNKSLFLNGLDVKKIYSWIGEPRVLILMQEYIDSKPSDANLSQTSIESIFLEKGIYVFDKQQIASIQDRDKELSFQDPKKAITLGKRLGAEMVVSGKHTANFSREILIGGYKQFFYSSVLSIRAYNTATGEILLSSNYSHSKEADTSALGKFDSALNSMNKTINSSKSDILFQIVKNWYDSFSKPKVYQVIIHKIDYMQLEEFKTQTDDFDGLIDINVRSFSNNIAEVDIKYESLEESFLDSILKSGLPYKIIGMEQNRIQLERK